MTRERAVRAEDIERYRHALTELGGEASLERLAEHAGTGDTDIGYIAACLTVVPSTHAVFTAEDPPTERVAPFALPSARCNPLLAAHAPVPFAD